MKRKKSQRRVVRDCGTPIVSRGGSYYNPRLKIEVSPVGDSTRAVTFEISWWQFRDMLSSARAVASQCADQMRREASLIDDQMEVSRNGQN